MKQGNTALLPLGILLALAALTFWLRYATEVPSDRHDGKKRHDPDYIVNDAILHKLDAAGALQYTLHAREIRHYPDDDTTDLIQPRLLLLHPTRPPVTVSANHGHLSSKGERVDLLEKVEVRRAANDKSGELLVESPDLTVLSDPEQAFTKSNVVITQDNSVLRGVGMQVDNKLQTYLLESQVTGELESRFGRKKK